MTHASLESGHSLTRLQLGTIALGSLIGMAIFLFASGLATDLGFPLDDSWIHSTYSRNLAITGEWVFRPGMFSAGSTSPLWTVLLVPGYWFGLAPLFWSHLLGFISLVALAIATEMGVRSVNTAIPAARALGRSSCGHGMALTVGLGLRHGDPAACCAGHVRSTHAAYRKPQAHGHRPPHRTQRLGEARWIDARPPGDSRSWICALGQRRADARAVRVSARPGGLVVAIHRVPSLAGRDSVPQYFLCQAGRVRWMAEPLDPRPTRIGTPSAVRRARLGVAPSFGHRAGARGQVALASRCSQCWPGAWRTWDCTCCGFRHTNMRAT